MTTTTTKTRVESTWTLAKVQEEASRVFARNCFTAMSSLEQAGPEAVKTYQDQMLKNKVDFYKSMNVKTPMELVKAMAEFETNVFGSKVVISGDEKNASLSYESCACMEAMKKDPNFKPEMMEKMGKHFAETTEKLGKEFGMKGEMKMVGQTAELTFSKEAGSCCG